MANRGYDVVVDVDAEVILPLPNFEAQQANHSSLILRATSDTPIYKKT